VRRGAAGVGSRGVVAAGAVAVAGSRELHSLQHFFDMGARAVSLRNTVLRRTSVSLSSARSHNVRSGGVMGLGLATQAFLGGLGCFDAVFHGEIRTRSACVHIGVQEAGIRDAV
jgi:hypothetical protein